jgi:diacylglycerol kinase family enzyme
MDLILYNPKSKNSHGNVQTHKLIKKYKKTNTPFRLKSILKVKDLRAYLSDNPHFEKIILLGGDGTIHKMVNDLVDSDFDKPIYIKKNGSGNDFLRSLKDNDKKPQYVMHATLDDISEHYFINGTGIGLDGLIINYVDNAKTKGKFSYFLSSIKGMINYIPEDLNIVIDDIPHHFKNAYLVTVNNGRFIGGGMQISPNANINDKDLDVIIVHSIKKAFLLLIFSTIYLGIHTKFKKYVFSSKCKKIDINFTTPQITQSDGERTDDITSMKITCSHKTVNLKAY